MSEVGIAKKAIKEYRESYGQAQLTDECWIQLMILHAKKMRGAIVECIEKPDDNFIKRCVTVGKEYLVIAKDGNDYLLIDDNGEDFYYQKKVF